MEILKRNPTNMDSLGQSIALLDSAIALDSLNYNYYSNKLSILCMTGASNIEVDRTIDKLISFNKRPLQMKLLKANVWERRSQTQAADSLYKQIFQEYNEIANLYPDSVSIKLERVFSMVFVEGKEKALGEYLQLKQQYPTNSMITQFESYLIEFDRAQYIESVCK